jgi:hypothetical protein
MAQKFNNIGVMIFNNKIGHKIGVTTFSITTLSIMTFSIRIKNGTLSIMTFILILLY